LTPLDPQRNDRASEVPESDPPATQKKWIPTRAAFEKFLASFSSNPNEAAEHYEIARLKLIRFFERRHLCGAERLADESLDRVMRRIDEGEVVTNMMAYVYRVASYVVLEAFKEQEKIQKLADMTPLTSEAPPFEEDEETPRSHCFDRCLSGLEVETKTLILDYYREDGQKKIQLRRQIAEKLGIGLNALRIRAHKIRVRLEQCVEQCLDQPA
jgi:DNA-directed RNA polymerase specialized sigma24 family protein